MCSGLLALVWSGGWFPALGAVDWPVLSFVQATTNSLSQPTSITHAGDGSQRVFITERLGRIRILQGSNVLAQPFLDLTNKVLTTGSEQGLLSVAFPPGFSSKRYFYVNYTRKPDGAVTIARFQLTADNNLADTNSEQVILTIPKVYNYHNGGQIAFGPDGYLYIGVGDGGPQGDSQLNGQRTTTLYGKILRLDVESGVNPYVIPPSNPFVGNTNYMPHIWAYGVRNPWRFSFDRVTGDFYLGDVGQYRWEEIDFVAAGSPGGNNFGWRIREGATNYVVPIGFTNFASLTEPVATYDHWTLPTDAAGSVTGGYVYRGPGEPRMDGVYFYGDFMCGWIWGLKREGMNWQNAPLLQPGITPSHYWISTFGEDEAGRLYLADYNVGKIYRIEDLHQVWTPVFTPTNGFVYSNSVIVSCLTTNASIRYTTNGLDPTPGDFEVPSTGILPVANGATNKVRAFRADLAPSGVATGVFTYRVGTPYFTPPQSAIASNTLVSLATVTPGASLYFTTNSSTPTTNSALYSGPLTLSGPVTVRALGVAPGYSNSVVGSVTYTAAQVATPVFLPIGGPITNGTTITISNSTPGATLYYTVDGSNPTTNSPVYTGPFVINGGTTVKAFGVAPQYLNSSVRSTFYQLVQTATPAFSPPFGPLNYGTNISISCPTPGATIYYTVDGTPPTTNSPVYAAPLLMTNSFTLSAFAIAPEHLDSAIASWNYTLVKAAQPVFTPTLGPLTNGEVITITSATPEAFIRYTTNGATVDETSPLYNAPLALTSGIWLHARAYAPQFDPSDEKLTFFGLKDYRHTVVTTLAGMPEGGYTNGAGRLARFSNPQSICRDAAGNLYVADTGNHSIRRITPTGAVETFAGTGIGGSAVGWATNSQFRGPTGVCLDRSGNVYVADSENCNRVCQVQTNGLVTVFANITGCNYASALWQLEQGPDGNFYLGYWFGLRRIAPNGNVAHIAGTGCNCPGGWGMNIGPGIDAATNIYSATGGNLWRTTAAGVTDLFAGGMPAHSDGPRLSSGFYNLQDASVDAATNIFLSDALRIRKLGPDGWVSTLAGTGEAGYRNGRGEVAQFNDAAGLCLDTNGNIYVTDAGNNCIRKISPDTANIGIADDWQQSHFGAVGINPNADADHDGMSNYAEFWAGTNPTNATSALVIDTSTLWNNNQLQIRWPTVAGKTYVVQYSSNLVGWATLGSNVIGDGTMATVIDPASLQQIGKRYYRILLAEY